MKKLLPIITLLFICLSSCSSSEKAIQKTGFRPYHNAKTRTCMSENYIGYGNYIPPRRKGVDR